MRCQGFPLGEEVLPGPQASLDLLPGFIIDDSQVLEDLLLPLLLRTPAVDPPPDHGMVPPFPPVEGEAAHVLRVPEHHVDGVGSPVLTWVRGVQVLGNGLLTHPLGEAPENLAEDHPASSMKSQ